MKHRRSVCRIQLAKLVERTNNNIIDNDMLSKDTNKKKTHTKKNSNLKAFSSNSEFSGKGSSHNSTQKSSKMGRNCSRCFLLEEEREGWLQEWIRWRAVRHSLGERPSTILRNSFNVLGTEKKKNDRKRTKLMFAQKLFINKLTCKGEWQLKGSCFSGCFFADGVTLWKFLSRTTNHRLLSFQILICLRVQV